MDCDSTFQLIAGKSKFNNITYVHGKIAFGLQSRKNYHHDIENKSYVPIMNKISKFLESPMYDSKRVIKAKDGRITNPAYEYLNIITKSMKTHSILINYLSKYPFITHKYLNYLNYKEVYDLRLIENDKSKILDLVLELKKNHNTTRTIFNYDYLYHSKLLLKSKKLSIKEELT